MRQWLFEVRGEEDAIKKKNDASTTDGWTPMYVACWNGHLSVYQWFFEVRAAEDIAKTCNSAIPVFKACHKSHLPVCLWLIFNEALKDPATQHVDQVK